MSKNQTILIVEDNSTIGFMLSSALEKNGFATIRVEDGEAALRELDIRPGNIDLVITDHNMPNMTGIELLRRMRENPLHRNTHVIMSSARLVEDEELRKEAEKLEAVVIEKPYRPSALLMEIYKKLNLK